MDKKINKDQYEELVCLYVTCLVAKKYQEEQRDRFALHAKILDRLKLPFIVQNTVAFAGSKRKNWNRYNKDVITDAIEAIGYTLDF